MSNPGSTEINRVGDNPHDTKFFGYLQSLLAEQNSVASFKPATSTFALKLAAAVSLLGCHVVSLGGGFLALPFFLISAKTSCFLAAATGVLGGIIVSPGMIAALPFFLIAAVLSYSSKLFPLIYSAFLMMRAPNLQASQKQGSTLVAEISPYLKQLDAESIGEIRAGITGIANTSIQFFCKQNQSEVRLIALLKGEASLKEKKALITNYLTGLGDQGKPLWRQIIKTVKDTHKAFSTSLSTDEPSVR